MSRWSDKGKAILGRSEVYDYDVLTFYINLGNRVSYLDFTTNNLIR